VTQPTIDYLIRYHNYIIILKTRDEIINELSEEISHPIERRGSQILREKAMLFVMSYSLSSGDVL
jgi:hypothetical protein